MYQPSPRWRGLVFQKHEVLLEEAVDVLALVVATVRCNYI